MKKDVRSPAALHLKRLETAMSMERRWSRNDFESYLVRHPLLGHVPGGPFSLADIAESTMGDVLRDLAHLSPPS